jgi:hypothetical protein
MMIDNQVIGPVAAEADNLALHVQLCEQRYLQLIHKFDQVDQRFEKIETVLLEIKDHLGNNNANQYKTYLAWSGAAITGLIAVIAALVKLT